MMAMSDTKVHIHITPTISFLFIESEVSEPLLATRRMKPTEEAQGYDRSASHYDD